MPWNNDGDGKGQNPWGSGGGPRKSGGGKQSNVEDMFNKSKDRFKGALPGGKGFYGLMGVAAVILWISTGFYSVAANEEAVVLRFGKWTYSTGPGLHLHLPYPIETEETRGVTNENAIEIGSRSRTSRQGNRSNIPQLDESLMLTGDENIVDIKFNVVWRIIDLKSYLFHLSDPDGTVKDVSESVMRELVGKNAITPIITTARGQLEQDALTAIQSTLDEYQAGVQVLRVQIIESEAPEQVKDAFLDVQRAEANQQEKINDAIAYKNKVIPEARGEAEKLIQEAEAYASITVADAEGKAARFLSVYNAYVQAKDVTKRRIYLETMEEILAGMDKTILDTNGGTGVVPYLSINELNKKKGAGQ